jgi:hypothetical protein
MIHEAVKPEGCGRRAGGVSVSGFGDLRRLVAAAMAGVGLKRKVTIVLKGKVERRGYGQEREESNARRCSGGIT